MTTRLFTWNIVIYVLLFILALFFLVPFAWMLTNAFKPTIEIVELRLLPSRLTLEHFIKLSSSTEIWRNAFNSFFVSSVVTCCSLLFSSMVAYGLAKIDFPGRKVLFVVISATLLIPGSLVLIPKIMIIDQLNWINTYYALIVPAMVSPYNVFFFRQFFMGIPMDLNHSAFIDGASQFDIYTKIILPLAKPALITLGILQFLATWDDFMWPLLVTNTDEMRTLPVVVATLANEYDVNLGEVMTIGSITAVPIIIVYSFLQKHFVNGLVTGGLKM
ncbi:hypothetical protein B1748_17370 [Paenibacillus sp. MY03]|uniref:carbohydrate ABC transporter permease n=1 Tax=Paenibacillus sp. MY03 TaxID=302980 RepID=UPI000B3D4A5C|nr:carbohydrate ABC transporter permease [Paenibacillus sp. MY03]OUS75265.1 hypothetical protein B1748_17370 [Paenibacillus sp. MY03]